MNELILLPIVVPILLGFVLLFLPEKVFGSRKMLVNMTCVSFLLCALLGCFVISGAAGEQLFLFWLVRSMPVYFAIDNLGRLFAGVVTLVFVLVGFFSLSYMQNEENERRYYAFYLITYGVLMGLDFAGNLMTLYLFYELMTLVSAPLVFHHGTKEAVMAGLKYLLYSFGGAYMALFGIFYLSPFSSVLTDLLPSFPESGFHVELAALNFVPGGSLDMELVALMGNNTMLLVAVFLMILGFSVKAGMFPLHAWLPTAHPVAPAPASAFLSGVIVKGGVFAIIRTVFYCVGADVLRGTWVQTVWAVLAIVTLVMGSALAFKEKALKKRLAYSTVSNLSYILLGISMLNTTAFVGSLLHVVFHAVIKSALFLFAGALIFNTGRTKVNDFIGLAGRMPILYWCYTVVSLGLVGIPPTSGLVSKWYLAIGCLESQMGAVGWIGAAALLVSALLTAGYLLPISIKGFLYAPVDSSLITKYHEPAPFMLVPIMIFAALTIMFGICPAPFIDFISGIAAAII